MHEELERAQKSRAEQEARLLGMQQQLDTAQQHYTVLMKKHKDLQEELAAIKKQRDEFEKTLSDAVIKKLR